MVQPILLARRVRRVLGSGAGCAEDDCMCGLAGIFDPDGAAGIDAALLRRMTAAIRHRGPDGDGFLLEPGIGLGHRRLAIIDPRGGQQPMYNEDSSVGIVFNGIIYNFRELRTELQARGHIFRTNCDTETIIHAWEDWGEDCLQRLDGFFALALWDRNRRVLFLARDRLGKKPIYYATLPDGRFVFGSEMAALNVVPGLPRSISATAVEDFFAYGYVPEPGSIYRQVNRLPAAHYLLLRHEAAIPEPRRYWHVSVEKRAITESEAVAELNERLSTATASRLIADVPLGAFLSGGVDSSAVVAAAGRLRDGLDTFTIGFAGAEDETPFADMVARRYGTAQHNEAAAAIDYIDAARQQGRIFGEPFGDQSSVPTFRVSALARRHATVALSGDGGDEVFAGYRRYRWHSLVEAARAVLPAPVRRGVVGRLARLYPKLDRAPQWLRAKHTLTELSLDSALGYYRTVARVQDERRRALFSPQLEAALDGHDPTTRIPALMDASGSDDPLVQAQYVDIHTWLVGDILTKVDRASMANSLEVRAPFLDCRFVEWGLSLPPALKLRAGEGKYILKKALEPLLPREVLYRRKQGFAMSLASLFRREADRVRGRLLGETMLDCGLFEPRAITQLLDEHAAGRFDHSMALWHLLIFEGFLFSELSGAAPAEAALAVPA
ncbi:MAG TPA: XrtA/PEP-CTERM system amidotransferase [Acetobacteraceae bacterium]|nr:XrtA/PEP-CTERM system amidotransferase [Acetobacteraceae bacterium]